MSPAGNDPNAAKGGGLWARLRGAFQPPGSAEASGDVVPTFDEVPQAAVVPMAQPVTETIPVATPVRPEEVPEGPIPEAAPVAATAEPERCSYCKTPRVGDALFCFDCGMMFPEKQADAPLVTAATAGEASAPSTARLADRYELGEQISVRGEVTRFRGLDHGIDPPAAVVLVRMPYVPAVDNTMVVHADDLEEESDSVHGGVPVPVDEPATSSFSRLPADLDVSWPGVGWEWNVLNKARHPCLPRVLDHFHEGRHYYLVEEVLPGVSLWDAWDDADRSPAQRFDALAGLAEGLKKLHEAGAIIEGLRPEVVVVSPVGQAGLTDLSDLLPLPVPDDAQVQATTYTAPELVLDREQADARADLYSFGAMLYALFLGRELTEMDFVRQGVPKPFVERDPDVHPSLARIVMKTFVREKEARFPTDEAGKEDPTGFSELANALRGAGRAMSRVRLDISSWTTTGKVRTGNEDAFALMHAVGSHQEAAEERALLILADGMGGAEAGEIASAMAIEHLRELLLQDPAFRGLSGETIESCDDFDLNACQRAISQALVDTNKHIRSAGQSPGRGKRGMGCTAEVVYIDGQRLVVGHVGDSRTYHYTHGKLVQLTRDQTLVNRLIELGRLTPDEAEHHPQKNELQQAIGGQPFLEPGLYHAALRPGEWVLVCSDGLTNHVDHATLTEMVQRADSAEMLARRLCNLANLQGGSDNCTVIAVRVT